jgi:4-alpha-glucanotransferase
VGCRGRPTHWDLIRLVFRSAARLAILPLQDVLGLGSESVMNRPGVQEGNWRWRLDPRPLESRALRDLLEVTATFGRARGR